MCNALLALMQVCSASIPSFPPTQFLLPLSSPSASAAQVEAGQRGSLGASLLQQILAAAVCLSSAARDAAAAALLSPYLAVHGARGCLQRPSPRRWGPAVAVALTCCWSWLACLRHGMPLPVSVRSLLSVMPACHLGEAWLLAQAALSLKEAKLPCHGRTAGDSRARRDGGAPECCVLLLCHS